MDEVLSELEAITTEKEKQRIGVLLCGEYDKNNAIVSFHPGAGGANPFCCDSKEKEQIDQNLERAQSLDENEKDAESTEEKIDEQEQEKEKKTIQANILQTDGSGDAPQTAVATAPPKTFVQEPQEVPVTASTSAAAQETSALNVDATGLLQAPVLPSTSSTPQPARPASSAASESSNDSNVAPKAPEEPKTNETNEAPEKTDAAVSDVPESPALSDAPNAEKTEQTSNESKDAQNKQNTQDEPSTQNAETAQESSEAQEEKKAETPTPVNAARSSRRGGPQRAATRQIAQRADARPVAVPQTRAASTLPASTSNEANAGSSAVSFRTRAVVRVAASSATANDETPIVSFRTRVVVP